MAGPLVKFFGEDVQSKRRTYRAKYPNGSIWEYIIDGYYTPQVERSLPYQQGTAANALKDLVQQGHGTETRLATRRTAMSTIDKFSARTAAKVEVEQQQDMISVDEMAHICPVCADKMKAKGIKAVAARAMVAAMLADDQQGRRTAAGPGNVDTLIAHWKKQAHPFTACRAWAAEHKGDEGYPTIKDADAFCGKMKALISKD